MASSSIPAIPEESGMPYLFSRRCKISIFQPSHYGLNQSYDSYQEILLHKDDFPGLVPGDVVEIYYPENEEDGEIKVPRLLLMISKGSIYPDNGLSKPLNRDTVNVEKSVAETFQLPNYIDVIITKVEKKDVTLDSVELTFNEKYVGRSEMWRLSRSLRDCCVYLNQKVDLCQGQVRCQVHELWSQGHRVSSGVITNDTKVVFRSPTAMVYLFIQMSSEMWQYDVHGELFFEKAINGFLAELFNRWEQNGSSHEVTIVMFSRCFYKAQSIDDFPERMRDCLQMGYNKCFYEDFYRVVVQNERFDDWTPTVRQLKQIFTEYKRYILDYHRTDGNADYIPEPVISSAAQGNFLEVLNMSLNTFEHHYLNRNLDRTGQQSIVITPGVGIFEVDRQLTLITKQRIIDSGVGSDLICVGEQPLHAVPLFKYHHREANLSITDDYSMPHWINLSFYSKNIKVGYSNYKSRINIPSPTQTGSMQLSNAEIENVTYHISAPPLLNNAGGAVGGAVGGPAGANDANAVDLFSHSDKFDDELFDLPNDKPETLKRKMSDPELSLMASSDLDTNNDQDGAVGYSNGVMSPGSDTTGAVFSSSWDDSNMMSYMEKARKGSLVSESNASKADKNFIGSIDTSFDHQAIKKYLLRPGRALINPFDPSQTTVKLSSNRRRWTHIFPKGPTGQYQQVHLGGQTDLSEVLNVISQSNSINAQRNPNYNALIHSPSHELSLNQVWAAAAPQTGVDWKSLTIPASLPITTDYFPDPLSLVNDYVVNEYELVPEDIISEASERSPLDSKNKAQSNEEIFTELISQRLAQGFQLILLNAQQEEAIGTVTATANSAPNTPVVQNNSTRSFASKLKLKKSGNSTPSKKLSVVLPQAPQAPTAEFWLSIGRIFHRVTFSTNRSTIKVTRYRPRCPVKEMVVHYRYRFAAPDNDNYEVSWVEFRTEKLENFNWNHMDFYVCTKGDREFLLTENLKYWRFRLVAIPLNLYSKFNKKIMESAHNPDEPCDIYDVNYDQAIKADLQKMFLRFIEVCLNRIRKPVTSLHKRPMAMNPELRQLTTQKSSSGMREQRANTISIDRSQLLQKRRHPSGGQGSIGIISSLGHLSPETKGSNSSMEQSGSYETHYLGRDQDMDDAESTGRMKERLKLTSTLVEIADAMKNGLYFVNKAGIQGMPPCTFVAFEAVHWIMDNVEGVETEGTALRILKNMQEKRMICHASGNSSQPFVNGFYFFYLHPNPKEDVPYRNNVEQFKNDWVEVEYAQQDSNECTLSTPEFLHETMSRLASRQRRKESLSQKPFYKSMTFDVDHANRSDRQEWGHLKYQHYYDPSEAFDMAVHWSVSSGAIISDLLHTWARKCQNFGLSLMPVPTDPFALPITQNSDPVRGPIFIELNTDCLLPGNSSEEKTNIFQQFPEDTRQKRLFLFREAIAHRFGFINSATDREQQPSSAMFSTDHQYVHCTGNMFLLIPTEVQLQTGIQGIKSRTSVTGFDFGSLKRQRAVARDLAVPKEKPKPAQVEEKEDNTQSFTRHLSQTKPIYDHSETGFLWSWNFMISRRWKMTSNTGATGEIAFMDKMLADFRAFCNNDNDRLKKFWQECMDKCDN